LTLPAFHQGRRPPVEAPLIPPRPWYRSSTLWIFIGLILGVARTMFRSTDMVMTLPPLGVFGTDTEPLPD
jgi:Na+/H+-dicarboxylate symporter